MNAVILAGGFGTRLKGLTENLPKTMLSVANSPLIDYAVSHLWDIGIKDFVFTLNYRPEDIIEWCIGYNGATCRFSLESEPLGTLGGVKAVEDFLHDVFIVISGDVVENINLSAMLNKHLNSGSEMTMAVAEVADISGFGAVEIDPWGRVISFKEKQGSGVGGLVNTGVYIVNKSVLKLVPKDAKLDFALDLLPVLASSGQLASFVHDGYWQDAGTLERFYNVNFDMLGGGFNKKAPNKFRVINREYNDSLVGSGSVVEGQIDGCIIGSGAYIDKNASLVDCIVMPNSRANGKHFSSIINKGSVLGIAGAGENGQSAEYRVFGV